MQKFYTRYSEIILQFRAVALDWVHWVCRCSAINDYLGENVWFVMHNGKNNDAIYLYMIYTILLNFFDFICTFLHDKVKWWIK